MDHAPWAHSSARLYFAAPDPVPSSALALRTSSFLACILVGARMLTNLYRIVIMVLNRPLTRLAVGFLLSYLAGNSGI
jgi:hypothetical protein